MVSSMKRARVCIALGLVAAGFNPAWAQYPEKQVDLIVPYAAGGGVGAMARVFAMEASKISGKQWIVHNREGAGGIVGFNVIAKSNPDGYTVGFSPASPMTNAPFINPKMPFANDDIVPVCQVFENVFAIAVVNDSPIKSLNDLLARAKEKPGALSYGHAGPASVPHLSIAALEQSAGVRFADIPYRGDGPAVVDAMGGSLDFVVPAIATLAGKDLRVLAVLADKRHPAMPEAPALKELGYPTISPGLNGLYVPKNTPEPVLRQLESLCKQVSQSPSFAKHIESLLQVPEYLSSADFQQRVKDTYETHAQLTPSLDLKK